MGITALTYRFRRNRQLIRRLSQALLCVLALTLTTCKAQQKSTNVQVINGQRFFIHKIEKKQSLYSISKLYKVPLDTLYSINPELKSGAKAGQEIRIPVVEDKGQVVQPANDTSKYITHRIAKGETLYSLARRYGITEKQLHAWNPALVNGAKEGQVIIVGEKIKRGSRRDSLALPRLPADTAAFLPPPKPRKHRYNVSVLLPFRLAQIAELEADMLLRSNKDFPPVPGLAADFFLGCKKAVDSLQTDSFAINLQLFDIDDNDSADIKALNNDPVFTTSDLVIGPLFASSFRSISEKAAILQTPIVSPFTQQNKILFNNIFISKTNPSSYTLLEVLADYCIDSLSSLRTNFILLTVSARDKKEGGYTEAFRQYFNDRMELAGRLGDTIRTANGMDGLKTVFSDSLRNVVIALSTNQVFIADFTTQLAIHSADKDVILCGWQNVTEMDNIDQEYLNQLQYTFPHQYDVTKRRIPALDKYYRAQQHTAPVEYYYYAGFDVMHYYLKNLRDYGPGFSQHLDQLPSDGAYLRFRFIRPDLMTGYDNRGVFIFRYKDYQLHKTGWR